MSMAEYSQQFYDHLRRDAGARRQFLERCDSWLAMRNETIATARELADDCDILEGGAALIKGISGIVGIGAGITCLLKEAGLVKPETGAKAQKVAETAFTVHSATSVVNKAVDSMLRLKASRAFRKDFDESARLFGLGLCYRDLQEDMRRAVGGFQRQALSSGSGGTASFNPGSHHRGAIVPHQREGQLAFIPLYMKKTLNMDDVYNIMRGIVRNIPELRNMSYGSDCLDIIGHYILTSGTDNNRGPGWTGQLQNAVELYKDKVGACVSVGKLQNASSSISSDEIFNVVKELESEKMFISNIRANLWR